MLCFPAWPQRCALVAHVLYPANGCGARGAIMSTFMLRDFVLQHVPKEELLEEKNTAFKAMLDMLLLKSNIASQSAPSCFQAGHRLFHARQMYGNGFGLCTLAAL